MNLRHEIAADPERCAKRLAQIVWNVTSYQTRVRWEPEDGCHMVDVLPFLLPGDCVDSGGSRYKASHVASTIQVSPEGTFDVLSDDGSLIAARIEGAVWAADWMLRGDVADTGWKDKTVDRPEV